MNARFTDMRYYCKKTEKRYSITKSNQADFIEILRKYM
jgi:hypothetical protein